MGRPSKPPAKKSAAAVRSSEAAGKTTVATTMRFDPTIKAALECAAKDDRRTASSLTMKILEDWLKERGYLK
jgi:hypothetical protein